MMAVLGGELTPYQPWILKGTLVFSANGGRVGYFLKGFGVACNGTNHNLNLPNINYGFLKRASRSDD